MTVTERVMWHLWNHPKQGDCHSIGAAAWPDSTARNVSANGGGHYAAQMLLGRLRRRGLVEVAPGEGSSHWRLTTKGERYVHEMGAR